MVILVKLLNNSFVENREEKLELGMFFKVIKWKEFVFNIIFYGFRYVVDKSYFILRWGIWFIFFGVVVMIYVYFVFLSLIKFFLRLIKIEIL